MGGNPEKHVLQVLKGRDVDQLAALDQRVQERGATSALEAPRKEPVLATHCHDPQLILRTVIVDGQAAVVDEALQGAPLIGCNGR